jgi:pilus assembly protein CpaD
LISAIAGSAAACASSSPPPEGRGGLTPTEQFSAKVTAHPDEILLAPHARGLSPAQAAALEALVDRWRDTGGGPIFIQTPGHSGGEAYHSATAVEAKLLALGVREDSITLTGYENDDQPVAPIVVGFDHYEVKRPVCGRNWTSFTTSMSNAPVSNFGCAVTADIAAMVANPADLAQPQPMDPSDDARRETVLGKYRAGAIMSSPKDDQADTEISDAVH